MKKKVIYKDFQIGGHAVAYVTQRLAEDNDILPEIQILIYPWVQIYSFLLPSDMYYSSRGFLTHLSKPIGRWLVWLLGITENITEEMENSFIANNHTLLIEDENLRNKYQSYLDIDLIPEQYKKGKIYYDGYKSKKVQDLIYPKKLDDSNILKKDKKLAELIKTRFFSKHASPALADESLLKKLPKAYFVVFEWDTLKDQSLIYAERLRLSGVPVKIAFYGNISAYNFILFFC